jgi:hypothetical protein
MPQFSQEFLLACISVLLGTVSGLIVWYGRTLITKVDKLDTAVNLIVKDHAVQSEIVKRHDAELKALEATVTEAVNELAIAAATRSRR